MEVMDESGLIDAGPAPAGPAGASGIGHATALPDTTTRAEGNDAGPAPLSPAQAGQPQAHVGHAAHAAMVNAVAGDLSAGPAPGGEQGPAPTTVEAEQ